MAQAARDRETAEEDSVIVVGTPSPVNAVNSAVATTDTQRAVWQHSLVANSWFQDQPRNRNVATWCLVQKGILHFGHHRITYSTCQSPVMSSRYSEQLAFCSSRKNS